MNNSLLTIIRECSHANSDASSFGKGAKTHLGSRQLFIGTSIFFNISVHNDWNFLLLDPSSYLSDSNSIR